MKREELSIDQLTSVTGGYTRFVNRNAGYAANVYGGKLIFTDTGGERRVLHLVPKGTHRVLNNNLRPIPG